jgi:hypothetical protein
VKGEALRREAGCSYSLLALREVIRKQNWGGGDERSTQSLNSLKILKKMWHAKVFTRIYAD